MLKINNLHASVDDKAILRGINLEVKPGEVHAIMGQMALEKVHWHLLLLEKRNMKLMKAKSIYTMKT